MAIVIFMPVAMVRPGEAEHPTEVLWAQEHGSQGYFQARPWSIPSGKLPSGKLT